MDSKRAHIDILRRRGNMKNWCSGKLDEMMDQKPKMLKVELDNAKTWNKMKTENHLFFNSKGIPVTWSNPPGGAKAAANTNVRTSVEISMHDSAVFFVYSSLVANISSCSFQNSSSGVYPFLFLIS